MGLQPCSGERVVPLAVERVGLAGDGVELGVGDLGAFRVAPGVAFGVDLEPGACGRRADEVDDDLMAGERPTPPVHGDVAEESMLDPVPLACARWEMTDVRLARRFTRTDARQRTRAAMEPESAPSVFAIVSWGAAVTTWLARALNSHPEVLALHHANVKWSWVHEQPLADPARYLDWLVEIGEGYRLVGDVHAIDRQWIPSLSEHFGPRFGAAVVVREPLARLRSQLALFRELHYSYWGGLEYVDAHAIRCGIERSTLTARDRCYLHGINMLNAITEEQTVGRVFRMEDLTTSARSLVGLLDEISGHTIGCPSSWVREVIRSKQSNSHATGRTPAAAELAALSVNGRGFPMLLRTIVSEDAWRAYEALGYREPLRLLDA